MKEITKEMRDALRKPLPTEAVKQHPTKTYLSSIKAIYVTERMSDVFGVGSWRTKISNEQTHENGMVTLKVTLEIPEYGVYYECYGGNDNGGENSKNFDLGDAYKGATTDALTKIGSWLEIGIDVFKGLQSNGAAKEPVKEDNRKWLNKWTSKEQTKTTLEWANAVEKLIEKKIDLKTIEANYKLSKELKSELETIANTNKN